MYAFQRKSNTLATQTREGAKNCIGDNHKNTKRLHGPSITLVFSCFRVFVAVQQFFAP
jgi:hypothetical protein